MTVPAGVEEASALAPRRLSTDALVLSALAFFALLAVACHQRVPGWRGWLVKDLAVAVTFVAASAGARRLQGGAARFLLRTAAVSLAFAYLFAAVAPLQHIIHAGWLDGRVLTGEQAMLGVQPVLWLERFVRPCLTEWMMFAYVVYLLLYPLVCGMIWARQGELATEECFFTLGLANVLCDLGFIVFPVAGPSFFLGDRLRVPLDGYMFTFFGELVRARLQYPGGSLPSPHCAAATVLWAMAWRCNRRLGLVLAPVVLTLYVSTVYGRYHYASDGVAGILTALVALAVAPALLRWVAGRGASRWP